MNYFIKPSQLGRPGREFALEKISISVGELVTGGCQFAIGRKDAHVRVTRGSFKAKLRWLDQKHITLWDVVEERGWLLNGTAVLLHLLRMSLESSKVDKFRSEFLFQEEKFAESPNPLTLNAPLDVLLNATNQKLELYPKDEYSYTETKLLSNGRRETVTKTVTSCSTVKDRVEELYETLEKLIDHHATSEASYKGVNAKPRLHDHLEGWDFADIATDRDPFYIKKARLPLHLLSWIDFTRAIPAITLFGKGFGDMIRASPSGPDNQSVACPEWETVPKNRHLLCVSVADLRDIIDRTGDQWTNPITVGPEILWKNPNKESPFHGSCLCLGNTKGAQKQIHHHPIQEVISTKLRFSLSESVVDLANHQNGAVIFGPKPEWKASWGLSASAGLSKANSFLDTVLGNSDTSQQSNTGESLSGFPSSATPLSSENPDSTSSRMISYGDLGLGQSSRSGEQGTEQECSPSDLSSPKQPQAVGVKRKAAFWEGEETVGSEGQTVERPSKMRQVAESFEKRFKLR